MAATDRRAGRDLLALARMLPEVSRAHTALATAIAAATSAASLGFVYASGRVVADLVRLFGHDLTGPAGGRFLAGIWLLGGLYLVQQVLEQAGQIHGAMLTRRVDGRLRDRAIAATLAPTTVDLLHDPAVRAGVDRARELAPAGFTPGQAAAALVAQTRLHIDSVIAAVLLGFAGQWLLLAALGCTRAVGEVAGLKMFWANLAIVAGGGADQRRSSYFRDLALRPGAAKEVRIFGLVDWVARRNQRASLDVLERAWRTRRNHRTTTVVALAEAASHAAAATLLGFQALHGDLGARELTVALLLAGIVGRFNLDDGILALSYGAASVPAILELEDLVESARTSATTPTTALPAPAPRHQIVVEGLRYAYPGTDTPVFDGLDLTIPAGQRLAVVGLNGAGKTTLVRLLCGLLRPDDGRILVDGIDLAHVDPDEWRRCVAALFQHFVHYDLSARDNVALGAPAAALDDSRLDRLADDVGLSPLIERLPRGWDTILTPQFTGGTDLSGGQWQRLALARALHAVDGGARLLVLDEPTANLDVRAEAQLYDRFLELTGSTSGDPLTTLLISHRFSTVRRADRIVVIEHGRIIEDGSHESLLELDGRYAGLFDLQAARFTDA